MTHTKRRLTGGIVATVGMLGIAGAAFADGGFGTAHTAAATTASSAVDVSATSPAAAGTKAHHKHPRLALAARAEYGQLVVRRHGADVTVVVQRGTLTSITATGTGTATVVVTSVDGHAQTYSITTTSKLRTKGKAVAESALKPGEKVGVLAEISGGHADVVRLGVHPARAAAAGAAKSGANGAALSSSTGV